MPISSSSEARTSGGSYDVYVSDATLTSQLETVGLSRGNAANQAWFLAAMHDFIKKHPDVEAALVGTKDGYEVYEGAKIAVKTAGYTGSLNRLVRDAGASGGASVLGVFVDRFSSLAKNQGIELNECALSVAKVATDIGGAGVGSVTSVSGVGLVLLGVSVLSTYSDSGELAKNCFNPK
jgi:hypothetical protein